MNKAAVWLPMPEMLTDTSKAPPTPTFCVTGASVMVVALAAAGMNAAAKARVAAYKPRRCRIGCE